MTHQSATILVYAPPKNIWEDDIRRQKLNAHIDAMSESNKPWPVFICGVKSGLMFMALSWVFLFFMGYALRGIL